MTDSTIEAQRDAAIARAERAEAVNAENARDAEEVTRDVIATMEKDRVRIEELTAMLEKVQIERDEALRLWDEQRIAASTARCDLATERARATAAEQMAAELRAALVAQVDNPSRSWVTRDSYAALARTEPVAGRWCLTAESDAVIERAAELVAERDALRAEVEELREALAELRVDLAALTPERR